MSLYILDITAKKLQMPNINHSIHKKGFNIIETKNAIHTRNTKEYKYTKDIKSYDGDNNVDKKIRWKRKYFNKNCTLKFFLTVNNNVVESKWVFWVSFFIICSVLWEKSNDVSIEWHIFFHALTIVEIVLWIFYTIYAFQLFLLCYLWKFKQTSNNAW